LEAATAGEAEFEFGDGLVTSVLQLVFRLDLNVGLRRGDEVDLDFLFFDCVAGAERGGAGSGSENSSEKEWIQKDSRWEL